MFIFAVNFGFHHLEVMGLNGNPVKLILNSEWAIPELFPQL